MCYGCLNQEFKNSSMGHGGIAIKADPKFDGASADNEKFEGDLSKSKNDAKQVENSGFGE